MALAKRIAVTLPAGPRIEDTIARIQWAEEQGIPDAWFSDSGAPDTLTQVAAIAHLTKSIRTKSIGYVESINTSYTNNIACRCCFKGYALDTHISHNL